MRCSSFLRQPTQNYHTAVRRTTTSDVPVRVDGPMRADREYRVPAKSLLRSGSNTISIIIQPAITEAAARADAYPYDVPAQQVDPGWKCSCQLPCLFSSLMLSSGRPVPRATALHCTLQGPGMAPHLNRLRKPGCDFGWDWGPCFAPSGVCGPVQLIAYSRPHITGAL